MDLTQYNRYDGSAMLHAYTRKSCSPTKYEKQ